jgi:hypothetical protein
LIGILSIAMFLPIIVTRARSDTLAGTMQVISNGVDWSQFPYEGLFFANRTKANLELMIDQLAENADWLGVMEWSVICKNLGVERETSIKMALDNIDMIGNYRGSLPLTINFTPPAYGETIYPERGYFFLEGSKYALYGYQYAQKYNYDLEKWNATSAYRFFKYAINRAGHPVLMIDSDDGSWTQQYPNFSDNSRTDLFPYQDSPRYYDECASTIQCFLIFYDIGIKSALDDALYWWNWTNANLWTGEYYDYSLNWRGYECEAGFFANIVENLKIQYPDLVDWQNVPDDLQNRFLSQMWNSPQWLSDVNTSAYVVVHHYPANPQTRLDATIGAWISLYSLYNEFNSSSQIAMQNMLEGKYELPAWQLLINPTNGLFDSTTNKFRGTSWDENATDENTVHALELMFFMGIVPKTANLAIPVSEYAYEWIYDIDTDLFGINSATNSIRVSVVNRGDLEFIYGDRPLFLHFNASGTYNIVFSQDWNEIVSSVRMSELPKNREYIWNNIHVFGDINGDRQVDIYDSIMMSNALGRSSNELGWIGTADLNYDGIINREDEYLLESLIV